MPQSMRVEGLELPGDKWASHLSLVAPHYSAVTPQLHT